MTHLKTSITFFKNNYVFFLMQAILLYFVLFKITNFSHIHHVSNEVFELSKYKINLEAYKIISSENNPKLIGFFPNLITKSNLTFCYLLFVLCVTIILNTITYKIFKYNFKINIFLFILIQFLVFFTLYLLFFGSPIQMNLIGFISIIAGTISNINMFNDLIKMSNKERYLLEVFLALIVIFINLCNFSTTSIITIGFALLCLLLLKKFNQKLLSSSPIELSFVFLGLNACLAFLSWL